MRKKEPITYRNFTVTQQDDGKWLAKVEILSPKSYKLLFSSDEESVAKDTMQRYLESENAIEKKMLELGAHEE